MVPFHSDYLAALGKSGEKKFCKFCEIPVRKRIRDSLLVDHFCAPAPRVQASPDSVASPKSVSAVALSSSVSMASCGGGEAMETGASAAQETSKESHEALLKEFKTWQGKASGGKEIRLKEVSYKSPTSD